MSSPISPVTLTIHQEQKHLLHIIHPPFGAAACLRISLCDQTQRRGFPAAKQDVLPSFSNRRPRSIHSCLFFSSYGTTGMRRFPFSIAPRSLWVTRAGELSGARDQPGQLPLGTRWQTQQTQSHGPKWRPVTVLDEYATLS